MDEPLDELYLRWLYSQVGSVETTVKKRTYWGLLRQLYTTEFVWFVPNDDNRVMDGVNLRPEFLDEINAVAPKEWMLLPCSFLEMLVALSRRLEFEAEGETGKWFWTLIENLSLEGCNDAAKIPGGDISAKVDKVIWRTYEPNGQGGLFPLERPDRDQREVEIWYQLSAYVSELH